MNINLLIVGTFLIVSLIIGLFTSRGVKTFTKYAVGDKKFKTSTLVATIVATYFGGGSIMRHLECTYTNGLYYALPRLFGFLSFFIIGQIMALRMKEFLLHFSVAESMGMLFGPVIRFITAGCGILLSTCFVATQFKVLATIINSFLDIEFKSAIYLAAGITLLYTSFGGIKAVSFTDMFQFIIFGTLMFTLIYLITSSLDFYQKVATLFTTHPNFDIRQVVGLHSAFVNTLCWCLICITPSMDPTMMQRAYMATDVWQIRRTFTLTSGIHLIIVIIILFLSTVLLANNPHLNPELLVQYIIQIHPIDGIHGLTCIGFLALAMSTADSFINTASVLFAHDIATTLKFPFRNKLLSAKLFSIVIGGIGIWIAFDQKDLVSLLSLTLSFHAPIVVAPFFMAVLGFRPRSISVLLGMGTGFLTTTACKFPQLRDYFHIKNEIAPAMLMNLLFLVGSYYMLPKIPNTGWVGIKEKEPLLLGQQARRRSLRRWIYAAQNNLFWPARIIYRSYGFYILVTHSISALFVHKSAYFIYYIIAIIWSFYIIKYSFSADLSEKKENNRPIIALWNLGLIMFLFIMGPINFVVHGYQLPHTVFLFMNLVIANLLWPLYLVSILFTGGLSYAVLSYKAHNVDLSLSIIWHSVTYIRLIMWLSILTLLLVSYIRYKKMLAINKLKNYYLKKFN